MAAVEVRSLSSQARLMGVTRGVLILSVPKGSNAAKAGLKGSSRSDFGEVGRSLWRVLQRTVEAV